MYGVSFVLYWDRSVMFFLVRVRLYNACIVVIIIIIIIIVIVIVIIIIIMRFVKGELQNF